MHWLVIFKSHDLNELYALYAYSIIFQYYARESWFVMDFQYVKKNILNFLNRHIINETLCCIMISLENHLHNESKCFEFHWNSAKTNSVATWCGIWHAKSFLVIHFFKWMGSNEWTVQWKETPAHHLNSIPGWRKQI